MQILSSFLLWLSFLADLAHSLEDTWLTRQLQLIHSKQVLKMFFMVEDEQDVRVVEGVLHKFYELLGSEIYFCVHSLREFGMFTVWK